MARPSNNKALGIVIQTARGTFDAPNDTTDLLIGMSNLRFTNDPVTLADDSYTGAMFQNADQVVGKRTSLSFNTKLKPNSTLPSANAWVLGRLFQAAKFTEVRNATAIGPEALGAWADSKTPTLGSSASSVADTYKGCPIKIGSGAYKTMSAIRSYDASKHAGLMEDWGSTPAVNYTIPAFLAYFRDVTSSAPPILSLSLWNSGVRFDIKDVAVTGMRIVRPTSTDTAPAYPEIEWTVSGTIDDSAAESVPTIPATGAVPVAKDGKEYLDYIEIGTASTSIDLGVQTERPPNMNQPDGVDAPELTGGAANGTIQMQGYLPSYIDTFTLADAQAYHPYFAQWGSAAGAMVQLIVADARLGFPSEGGGGAVILEDVGLYIDVINRNLGVVFPY